uniref:Rho GTPase activating protein 22 n=1 Tax=Oryzias latipes TaxID=8090 RepID=A0A3P9LMY1_ORYLA
MTVLISEHSQLYSNETPGVETLPPQDIQRFKVEWLPQENTDTSSSVSSGNPRETSRSSSPSTDSKLITSSLVPVGKIEETCNEGKGKSQSDEKLDKSADCKLEGQSEVDVSPSKQFKALPSWKGSFKGSGASGGPKGKIGGSAGDVSAAGGSKWLMNGLSSLRAHRRTTSSGEKVKDAPASLKDSTLSLKDTPLSLKDTHRDPDDNFSQASLSHRILHPSHRLSAYDNVAPSSLSLPADNSPIWTSYEISLLEPGGSDKALTPDQNKERPTEASDGTDTLDDSASVNEVEVTGTNEDVASRLTKLKQELKKQKINYETCIRKLEESCSMYQSQINHLEEELDQEKKKYHMLEIRLRNSERAHQDAENRNVLLQQEMEEFFKTLGDLTTGATRTK